MRVSRAGCFGKIPRQGDFVRHLADPLTTSGFDRWLQEGLAIAPRGGLPPELRTFRFVYFRDDAALCGVATPSGDRVGRRFPILVFVAIHGVADLGFLAPLLAADFMHAAQGLADVAARGVHEVGTLRQHVDSLHVHGDVAAETERLEAHLRSTSLRTLAQCALAAESEASVGAWFGNLALAVRGNDRPRYAVRSTCVDDPLWLASWLRLAAVAGRRAPRLLMWDRDDRSGPTVVRLLYDELAARYAPGMLYGGQPHDLAFDVRARVLPGVAAPRSRVLDDADQPLSALASEWAS